MDVHGSVDPRFEPVAGAFRENFDRGELGAACAVSVGGRVVVDLWGGWTDPGRTRRWGPDTLVNAYSVGKPLVAVAALQRVAAGELELDERADRIWPELRAGQAGATVRHLLCHRAGVPAIREPVTDEDLWRWTTMAGALARTDPWWPPGTRHAYHTNTYGFLAGELVRRTTGETPGAWLRRAVAGPLGADLAWGLSDVDLDRCADVEWHGPPPRRVQEADLAALSDEQRMVALGYANPPGFSGLGVMNTEAWRRAEVPSTNLHATARGVARVYAALAAGGTLDGVELLPPSLLAEAVAAQSEGWCPVLEREVTFGLGFQPTRPDRPFGPNAGSFGHFGAGGSLGFADPGAGVAFGYVMNAVRPRWQNDRNRALLDALYTCL